MSYPKNRVATYRCESAEYPRQAPYHPGETYPEYEGIEVGSERNQVYEGVRECFRIAGLDAENFGTAAWNPLRGLVRPRETVVLKPNLVKESHPRDPDGWRYVVTHGSVIRAVADYVWKALEGEGRVIVADAPQTDSSFAELARVLGLDRLADFYKDCGRNFEILDLRKEEWRNENGVIVERTKLTGDPEGYVAFDLGNSSEFVGHAGAGRYYGADYDAKEVNDHHTGGRHEYLVSGTAVKCDVLFTLPKLKTHKKAGITVSLKNLVGVNGDKNWLPHHTEAGPEQGGDEHPNPGAKHRLERSVVSALRTLVVRCPGVGPAVLKQMRRVGAQVFGDGAGVIRSGNWFGNDTIWRTCLDLNKIVGYGNADGSLREARAGNRKRHYCLVDGILSGEGEGPMNPDPVRAGMLVFGVDPVSVDATCAYLMGFDPERIPIVRQAFDTRGYPLTDHGWHEIDVVSNVSAWNMRLDEIADDATLRFLPHFGWKGAIERNVEAPAE